MVILQKCNLNVCHCREKSGTTEDYIAALTTVSFKDNWQLILVPMRQTGGNFKHY